MKLYLVRHGQSTGNTPGNLVGQSDHPLTPLGEAQARAVAARLAPLGPLPVHCSDLPRARATAEAIAAAWAPEGALPASTAPGGAALTSGLPVHPDTRLREIDLGEFEGRSWDEFLADTALGAALDADPYNTAVPGGESLAQLVARVVDAMNEIVAAPGAPGADGGAEAGAEAAVLVAHDGPIRAIINHVLEVPPQKWWALATTHGGLSLVEFADGWVTVRFVNDTSHLEGVGDALADLEHVGDALTDMPADEAG